MPGPRAHTFPAEPPALSSTLTHGPASRALDMGLPTHSPPTHTPQDSRQHYEIEYRHRAANLEKCMSELWRMERKRDKNVREMKVRGPLIPS